VTLLSQQGKNCLLRMTSGAAVCHSYDCCSSWRLRDQPGAGCRSLYDAAAVSCSLLQLQCIVCGTGRSQLPTAAQAVTAPK
jgi:hypothetical protein